MRAVFWQVVSSACLVVTLVCLLAELLLFFPAPSYQLWMLSVAVSELSLWISALMLIFLLYSALRSYRKLVVRPSKIDRGLFLLSIVCAAIGLVPTVQAIGLAKELAMPLSLAEYFDIRSPNFSDVTVSRAVNFAGPGRKPLLLDVYRAGSETQLKPAVIVVHGGSWRNGHRSEFAVYDYWLAESGFVVFDIDYRLALESARYPAQKQDVLMAIDWVKQHAALYGGDPSRIAMLGRSAGAQLAVLAAYEASASTDSASPVRCVISLYGPMDLIWDYWNPARPDVIRSQATLENYLGAGPAELPDLYRDASPSAHIHKRAPATLFLHGARDQIVLQKNVYLMAPGLTQAGVPFSFINLPWANHGFDVSFNGWSGQVARQAILRFLNKYLFVEQNHR